MQLHTGHTYASRVDGPLPTDRRVWMSEWNPSGSTWNENWDDGSTSSGFAVAQAIHDALTLGNVNAYVYWFGASVGNTRAFIQMDGQNHRVSKRLWAMANYSRFIRPQARRIAATTTNGNLRLSAYRDTDGSLMVVVLNAGSGATSVSYALENTGIANGTATPYLTNNANSTTAQSAIAVNGGSFTATVPGRSLVTYVVRGGTLPPAPTRYEAEDPPATCHGTIDSNHSGYSGTGFCNTHNNTGTSIQFTVNATSTGSATLSIRYANGSTGNRAADITVNGAVVHSASAFQPTGAWNSWATKTVTVPVNSASNTIRLLATTNGGLANIDFLDVEVTAGSSVTFSVAASGTPP